MKNKVRIAVLETQIEDMKENLQLQAKEYERRLEELNHAHALAAVDKGKFVTGELFYAKIDDMAKWRNEYDQWRSKMVGIAIGIGMAAGLTGGAIGSVLASIIKK